jgi:hypothetical protein
MIFSKLLLWKKQVQDSTNIEINKKTLTIIQIAKNFQVTTPEQVRTFHFKITICSILRANK